MNPIDLAINRLFNSGDMPNKFTIAVGERIRRARQEARMSQNELAQYTNTRQANISAMENGKTEPSSSELVYLSRALGKPITYFFPDWLAKSILPEAGSNTEKEMMVLLRKLDASDQFKLLAQVRALASLETIETDWRKPMFENDNPEDRESLIKALAEEGLKAFEWDSGGGITHVIVPIIDFNSEPPIINTDDPTLKSRVEEIGAQAESETYLYISTNSLQTDCEIGVMGMNGATNEQYASEEWKPAGSLNEAIAEFHRLWAEKDGWIGRFIDRYVSMI